MENPDMPTMSTCQVAVIGGGPAGCAAAIALSRAGIDDVHVLEAGNHDRHRVGESLPPDIRPLLQQLGLWEDFVAQRHARCLGNCSSWGSDRLGYSDYMLHPLGAGWHLDRSRFDRWIAHCATAAGAHLRMGVRLCRAVPDVRGHRLEVRMPSGRHYLHARFVIDATGNHARFARLRGAGLESLDQLFFVYGFFQQPEDAVEHEMTLVESVADGWWYRAGLPNRRMCLAFACDRSTLHAHRLNHWQAWLQALAQTRHASRGLKGHVFFKHRMQVMSAPSSRTIPVAGPGWLAVGDAASSFDPLLARGIHKAFEDGIAAATTIDRWLQQGVDEAPEYRDAIHARYATFRKLRKHFYAQETRWPNAAFWNTRTRASPRMRFG